MNPNTPVLLCVCYRPQWQGTDPLEYLQNNLDGLLAENSCKHLIIVGDMNQNQIYRQFDEFLSIFGLINHVTFPTHVSGSSIDPVITDMSDNLISCSALGFPGTSDHQVVRSLINIETIIDPPLTRTIWLWNKADWNGFREALAHVEWDSILSGSIEEQVKSLTNLLLALQEIYVPFKIYKVKPKDQPWFGYRCRVAADAKSKAWNRYKRHPTHRNKLLHTNACREMTRIQSWAEDKWKKDLRQKLIGRAIGKKSWWKLIKEQQGFSPDDGIPPLDKPDGSVALSAKDKAELLAVHFASKMQVLEPSRESPFVPIKTAKKFGKIQVQEKVVRRYLLNIDVKKASGPET